MPSPHLNSNSTPRLIRVTTVPMALKFLLAGQMAFMKSRGFEVLMISADGKELDDVKLTEDCPHVIVPMTRKITPLQDWKCLLQLIGIFKKYKPDIVHSHTPKAGLLAMLAAKFCGIQNRVHTVAGLPMMVEKGARFALLKNIEKLTYAAASQVWPNSFSLKEYIEIQKLASPKKLSVIGHGSSNGINLARYSVQSLQAGTLELVKNSFNYDESTQYILFIGRLVADKGVVELVDAFCKMESKSTSIKLLLIGDFEPGLDPLPAATLQMIGQHPSILHISWTPYPEYYMHLATLFVFPSHREGFPNVLLQAGAMSLPIICSKIAGNIDIVSNGETGLIFEKGNTKEMEEKMGFALRNSGQMQSMAARLQLQVEKNFSRETVWNDILSRYQSMLSVQQA